MRAQRGQDGLGGHSLDDHSLDGHWEETCRVPWCQNWPSFSEVGGRWSQFLVVSLSQPLLLPLTFVAVFTTSKDRVRVTGTIPEMPQATKLTPTAVCSFGLSPFSQAIQQLIAEPVHS